MKVLSLMVALFVSVFGMVGVGYGWSDACSEMMCAQMRPEHHHEMMMSTATVSGHHHEMMMSTGTHRSGMMKKNLPKSKESKKSALKPSVSDFNVIPSSYGRMVSCPVTGEKFKIAKDTPAVKYKDKEYYFCCPACIKKFKENPEKYTEQ